MIKIKVQGNSVYNVRNFDTCSKTNPLQGNTNKGGLMNVTLELTQTKAW